MAEERTRSSANPPKPSRIAIQIAATTIIRRVSEPVPRVRERERNEGRFTPYPSLPRKRESIGRRGRTESEWVPAFAGMTEGGMAEAQRAGIFQRIAKAADGGDHVGTQFLADAGDRKSVG